MKLNKENLLILIEKEIHQTIRPDVMTVFDRGELDSLDEPVEGAQGLVYFMGETPAFQEDDVFNELLRMLYRNTDVPQHYVKAVLSELRTLYKKEKEDTSQPGEET